MLLSIINNFFHDHSSLVDDLSFDRDNLPFNLICIEEGIYPMSYKMNTSICSVVVITVVSHTTGPQFDPEQMHFEFF